MLKDFIKLISIMNQAERKNWKYFANPEKKSPWLNGRLKGQALRKITSDREQAEAKGIKFSN